MAASAASTSLGVVTHALARRTHGLQEAKKKNHPFFPDFWLCDRSLYTVHCSVGVTHDFPAGKYRCSATIRDATHQSLKACKGCFCCSNTAGREQGVRTGMFTQAGRAGLVLLLLLAENVWQWPSGLLCFSDLFIVGV